MKTTDELIDDLLNLAFAEDLGDGDHTTLSTIPADAMGRSRLIIKEDGILAGVDIAEKVLHKVDPTIKMTAQGRYRSQERRHSIHCRRTGQITSDC